MNVVEKYIDEEDGQCKLKRTWTCCGNIWCKEIKPNDLNEIAWTPICPKCGGFDGTLFI